MKDFEFIKAVASGNDFIIVDRISNQKPVPREQMSKLAKELCQRKFAVGADGLLLLEHSIRADVKMRIFNPDGTEVEMCGNGSRCAAVYAKEVGICGNKMTIETRAGNLEAEVNQDKVKIKMAEVKDLRMKFDLDVNGQTYNLNYINTGVPHVVCFVQGLEDYAVHQTGKAIRDHPEFQPNGTNVDFVEVLNKDHIKVRTYERGVEQETLACGTGCVAAGIITAYQTERPQGKYRFKADTQGGETLYVYFNIRKDTVEEVHLQAEARIIYQGLIKGGLHV